MPTEYVEDHDLNGAVAKILGDQSFHEFDDLRTDKFKLISRLKVVTNKEGEHQVCKGAPARVLKVSDLHQSAGIKATHILVMDYYVFNHPGGVNPQITIDAILHKALKTVKVEKNKEGKTVFKKNEPEIVEFLDTARHYPPVTADQKEYTELLAAGARAGAASIATGTLEEEQPHVESEAAEPAAESDNAVDEEAPVVRRKGRNSKE